MITEDNFDLTKEWQELHNSIESYEHLSLLIKLLAISLTVLLITFTEINHITLLVLAVLWLQEGIWRTYQARTTSRIVLIERYLTPIKENDNSLTDENSTVAFQFYSQWNENRAGSVALIKEYIQNSIKPTVIYPYLPLMVIALIA